MKVEISLSMKGLIPWSQIQIVKDIVSDAKQERLEDYYWAIGELVSGNPDSKVFDATAEICKNENIWGRWFSGSQDYDVWVTAHVLNEFNGEFYIIGVYMSDLWEYSRGKRDEILSRCYVKKFKEEV